MLVETRLHRARIERGIDFTALAAQTRLAPDVLRRIDEGRFAELPAGIYARSYVRAFASAVGLDPRAVVEELQDVLPRVGDPIEGLRDARQTNKPPACAKAFGRAAAAALDALVLMSINGALVQVIAIACGVDVGTLLAKAGIAVAAFAAVPVFLYFIVFEGLGGQTPGARLWRLPMSPPGPTLRIVANLLRAVK